MPLADEDEDPDEPRLFGQSNGPCEQNDPEHLRPRIEHISAELAAYGSAGRRVMATSSFQSNSVVLLHLLSRLAPHVPVYFLQTGYHFAETLRFRRELAERFGLEIRDVTSPVPRHQQRDALGRLLYASAPNRCCDLNKVLPLEPALLTHDVWVSGVRADQSNHRSTLGRTETGRHGVERYHPLLDWTSRDVGMYVHAWDLPSHPLLVRGYVSVGCAPCTADPWNLPDLGEATGDRGGRWAGMAKTECGLHTDVGGA